MSDNGSPELLFEPKNEIDDYTKATMYINAEFKNGLESSVKGVLEKNV